MKKKEERNEKQMSEIQAENKRLKEPLEKAKAEVADLKKQLANYQKDKQSLQVNFMKNEFSYLEFMVESLAYFIQTKSRTTVFLFLCPF